MNSATASGLASDKKTHSTSRLHHGKLRQIRCRCFQRTRQWTFSRIPGDMIAVHLFISRLLSKKKWPSLRRKMSALKKVRRKTRIVVFVHEQSLQRSLFFFLFLLLLNVISGASNGGFGVVVFFLIVWSQSAAPGRADWKCTFQKLPEVLQGANESLCEGCLTC